MLILASASPTRLTLLTQTGLTVTPDPAWIDERAAEAPLADLGADDIAAVLAEAKAQDVSARRPGALVIGADQTLECDGKRYHKPQSQEAARAQLLELQGRTHALHSAVAVVRDGQSVFAHAGTAHLVMRPLTPREVGEYMALVGDDALGSVGAYQLEGPGARLMTSVTGDYFTVLGLPLLPLLAFLRETGEVAF